MTLRRFLPDMDASLPIYIGFGKSTSPACVLCNGQNDDAKHTLFECDAFHVQRRNAEMTIGSDLTAENIVEIMLRSKANWEAVI